MSQRSPVSFRRAIPFRGAAAVATAALSLAACGTATEAVELATAGNSRDLRTRPADAPPRSPAWPSMLILALDGVRRDILYQEIKAGNLPGFAKLLGHRSSSFDHAYFAPAVLSVLPSSTAPGWTSIFTGVPPGRHGVVGNEYFVGESAKHQVLVPTSYTDHELVLSWYTDGTWDQRIEVPTVYERIRERDPHVLIWVAMHPIFGGADRLALASRGAYAKALKTALATALELSDDELKREVFADVDREMVDELIGELDRRDRVPDILTFYSAGPDQYAHVAFEGPELATQNYLRLVLDPLMERLYRRLKQNGELEDRFVVITSDHGHTRVAHDDEHALHQNEEGDPPEVLRHAGFRIREFDDDAEAPFDAVLSYQGAMAYLSLADRSSCGANAPEKDGGPSDEDCDWSRGPRFREDTLVAAEAFRKALMTGDARRVEAIVVRERKPGGDVLWLYRGEGDLAPLDEAPRVHVDLARRLRATALGPYGRRAGDVILLSHYASEDDFEKRSYFSPKYHSWHGSANRNDSEIPVIVAHPRRSTSELRRLVGNIRNQHEIGELLIRLRFSPSQRPLRRR